MRVNDKKIVHYLKFFPFYIILFTNIIFLSSLFIDYKYQLTSIKENLQTTLNEEYKEKVKNDTQKLVSYINQKKLKNEEELKQSLKEKNELAYLIISSIYEKNSSKPKKEIINQIKIALDKIRFFDGRGYYYFMSMDGFNYFHPIFKNLENKSLLEVKDVKGTYLTKVMINSIKNSNEAYVKYYWHKQEDRVNQYLKIAHVRKFEPLNSYFVVSDYIDSLNKKWKEDSKLFINTINFKDQSHYFIIDKNSKKYVWHEKKELIGHKVSTNKYTVNGEKLLEEMINNSQNSFYSYDVYDKNKNIVLKTSYTSTIEDWDWIVGIGFYKKDIDNYIIKKQNDLTEVVTKNLFRTIIFLFLLSVIILFLSKYFSNIISRRFNTYNFSINRKIVEISRQQKILAQQSKMAAMGEMIENIAHQWRQPLSLISTTATGLKLNKEYDILDDKTFYSSLDSINDSAQYLSETIENFRNFYKKSNEEKILNISNVIEKSILLAKSKIDNNYIEIEKSIKKLKFHGLENELIQVILNIINNSIDQFNTINNENKRVIKIDTFKNEDLICIEITDNAGGVSAKIIDRIFEPYFTTKNKDLGTGIGLHMSKNIIEEHFNGTIEVKNSTLSYDDKDYKGAKFIIKIKE